MSVFSRLTLPAPLQRHSVFIGQVATLASGRAGAGVVALLLMPIVARIFAPADFGVAAFFLAVAEPLSVLATLRLEAAIVLPKHDDEALRLTWAAFTTLVLCVALLWAIGLLLLALGFPVPLMDRIGLWAWLIPLSVLGTASQRLLTNMLVRWQRFAVVASADVAHTLTTSGSRVALGAIAGSSVWALITGQFLGLATRIALMGRAAARHVQRPLQRPAWGAILDTAIAYRDFPLYQLPAGLLRSLSKAVVILFLGTMYSPAVVGYFAMAQRLVAVPTNMLGTAVRQSYLRRGAEIRNEGRRVTGALVKTTLALAAIGLVPTVVLVAFGTELLAWFLGDEWETAGQYAEVIALVLFSAWITIPASATLVLLRRQQLWLQLQIVVLIAQIGVLATAYFVSATPIQTITGFVAVRIALNALILGVTGALAKRDTPPRGPATPNPPLDADESVAKF